MPAIVDIRLGADRTSWQLGPIAAIAARSHLTPQAHPREEKDSRSTASKLVNVARNCMKTVSTLKHSMQLSASSVHPLGWENKNGCRKYRVFSDGCNGIASPSLLPV